MLDFLAEKKIAEAISRGELADLPGEGRPLVLEDDPLVPEDWRVAYRVLKNAGFALKDVQQKKLSLMKARIEARYFKKVVTALSSCSRSRRPPF